MRCLSSITESMDVNLSKLQEIVKGRKAWCAAEQTPGDSQGQESLVCCCPWGRRVGHDLTTTKVCHESGCIPSSK